MVYRFMAGWIFLLLAISACTPAVQGTREGHQTPASANTRLGVEYMREGMYKPAKEALEKAVKQDSSYQPAHSAIAVLYERLGEEKLAEKHYRKAYALDPRDSLTLNNYGQYLCRSGRYKEADRMFNTALKDPLYRRPETTLTNAGLCAARQSKQDRATEYFRKALKVNPKYAPALREMARISFAQKNWLGVRAYLQRLEEVGPLPPEFLWYGIQAEQALGDVDAQSSYALLLRNRYPDSKEAGLLVEWERKQSGQ